MNDNRPIHTQTASNNNSGGKSTSMLSHCNRSIQVLPWQKFRSSWQPASTARKILPLCSNGVSLYGPKILAIRKIFPSLALMCVTSTSTWGVCKEAAEFMCFQFVRPDLRTLLRILIYSEKTIKEWMIYEQRTWILRECDVWERKNDTNRGLSCNRGEKNNA